MSGEQLLFPSLEWFQALQQLANADETFRRLGSIDASIGVKIGGEVFLITFEAFRCTDVKPGADDDLFELDFFLEMEEDLWQDMVANIKTHGGADLEHTLNTLDLRLPGGISANATGDQFQADFFFRYNESLQRFFDLSAQLQTTFRDSAAT